MKLEIQVPEDSLEPRVNLELQETRGSLATEESLDLKVCRVTRERWDLLETKEHLDHQEEKEYLD